MTNKECFENFLVYLNTINEIKKGNIDPNSPIADYNFINSLIDKHLFSIDNDILQLLLPAYTKNKVFIRELTFDKIWILNSFDLYGEKIRGIIIQKVLLCPYIVNNEIKEIEKFFSLISVYGIRNEKVADVYNSVRKRAIELGYEEGINIYFNKEVSKGVIQTYKSSLMDSSISKFNKKNKDKGLNWDSKDKKLINNIKMFVCNFLDFLNNKDVKLVNLVRDNDKVMLGLKKNKIKLPTHNIIKLTGELKIYLDNLKTNKSFSFSHKFWVRGHFRKFSNIRYKTTNNRIWIKPFIKGEGILINKSYNIGGIA